MEQSITDHHLQRSSALFLALLLLAGVLHLIDNSSSGFFTTVLFCCYTGIYAGLLLFWLLSIQRRLLPCRAREYLLAAGGMMLFYLALRCVKYRVIGSSSETLTRWAWYTFYVPRLMIPTLFFMSCIGFYAEERDRKWDERWLLLPAAALVLGILTNDLHLLAFMPLDEIDTLKGDAGTYTYGVLFYAAYGWIILMTAGGILRLVRGSRRTGRWRESALPLLCMLMVPILSAAERWLSTHHLPLLYTVPEIDSFCMLGCLEYCLRNYMLRLDREHEERRARLEMARRVYAAASDEVRDVRRQIGDELEGLTPEDPDFRIKIEQLSVLYACVKRKSNLALIGEEQGLIPAEELVLSLEEMGRYLRLCGMAVLVESRTAERFGKREGLDLFEGFSRIALMLMHESRNLLVCLDQNRLTLEADCPALPSWPDLPGYLEQGEEDGLIYLTLYARRGGEG